MEFVDETFTFYEVMKLEGNLIIVVGCIITVLIRLEVFPSMSPQVPIAHGASVM